MSTRNSAAPRWRGVIAAAAGVFLMLGVVTVLAGRVVAQPAAGQATAGPRFALVVGNDAYPRQPLANAANDARAVAAKLGELGFTVELHTDLGRAALEGAMQRFATAMRPPRSTTVFFYAGHGVQIDGRNFILPVDANLAGAAAVSAGSIDVQGLIDQLSRARDAVNVVILDACRDNPFAVKPRNLVAGLAALDAPRGTLIAYSTAPGMRAVDGTGANSTYTQALLRALDAPGLKAEDVFKRVRIDVSQETNGTQMPWESSSLVGDFVFRPPAAAAPPAVQSAEAHPAPGTASELPPAEPPSAASPPTALPVDPMSANPVPGYPVPASPPLVQHPPFVVPPMAVPPPAFQPPGGDPPLAAMVPDGRPALAARPPVAVRLTFAAEAMAERFAPGAFAQLAAYERAAAPKALARSDHGQAFPVAAAHSLDDARRRSLQVCEFLSRAACDLVAENERLVTQSRGATAQRDSVFAIRPGTAYNAALVPFVDVRRLGELVAYGRAAPPKAIAVAPDGAYGWAQGRPGEAADALAEAAVARCRAAAPADCALYAVDETVVWSPYGPAPKCRVARLTETGITRLVAVPCID